MNTRKSQAKQWKAKESPTSEKICVVAMIYTIWDYFARLMSDREWEIVLDIGAAAGAGRLLLGEFERGC